MNSPNLSKIVETFIKIELNPDYDPIRFWQSYLTLLREKVIPLIENLRQEKLIGWFSLLVHNRASGVPTEESDNNLYVHIRLENLTESLDKLSCKLPSYCLNPKMMAVPSPPSLDNVSIDHLSNQKVEEGWKILGESSEWVLNMLSSHDKNKQIPPQNVAQFLHYLGNQLMVSIVRIPMP